MGLEKFFTLDALGPWRQALREQGRRVVLTNGCFDLLHAGHVRCLRQARELGDALVVAINTDASVRRLKGPTRPVQPERERAEILCALTAVDAVILFDEDTPLDVVMKLRPDVLAKGGDWVPEAIVGGREVLSWGGRVVSLPFHGGLSTTRLVEGTPPPA